MGWKNVIRARSETEFHGNGLTFATKEEADGYGRDLFSRWTGVEEYKAVETEEEVNYKWGDGRAIPIN
jgi:hypothetical protein